jgi:uncharacterized protein (DUF983 family)
MTDDEDDDRGEEEPEPPVVLGPDGKPVTSAPPAACPRCGAGPKERLSAGFGRSAVRYCRVCGFAYR